MRRRRWHLNVRKSFVHKLKGVFGACKLGEAEALGSTFENPMAGQTLIRVRGDKYEWESA